MRIIAGAFGSRRITQPSGQGTRPTLDKTREALFSMLQGHVAGAQVLDLFAGSGALGLEALSRGADAAVFCDLALPAAKAVRANIAALGVADRATLLHMDWARALSRLTSDCRVFDLIFLDPPYDMALRPVMARLLENKLLASQGLLVAEHAASQSVDTPGGLHLHKHRRYGDSAISIYGLEDSEHAHSDISRQL